MSPEHLSMVDSAPLMQIRKHLIAANAPQKGSNTPRYIQWSRSIFQAILKSAKEYAYGFKTYSRAGQTFQIPVAPIIDISTYELFVKMREENKPTQNTAGKMITCYPGI